MKIFVGSSTQNKNKARRIANALESKGFDVYKWWTRKVFGGGDITIERLIEMSDICDGAVFVFGSDDKTIIEKTEPSSLKKTVKKIASPRDNVILEYGIFSSKLGTKKPYLLLIVTSKFRLILKG